MTKYTVLKIVQEGNWKGQLRMKGEGKYLNREGEEQRRKRRKIFGLSCQGEGKREERRGFLLENENE